MGVPLVSLIFEIPQIRYNQEKMSRHFLLTRMLHLSLNLPERFLT